MGISLKGVVNLGICLLVQRVQADAEILHEGNADGGLIGMESCAGGSPTRSMAF